jgi:D-alanyl-D-alanine carboxypeptidase
VVSTLGDLRRWARDVATGRLRTRGTQKQRLRFIATDVRGVGYGLGLTISAGWIGHNETITGY